MYPNKENRDIRLNILRKNRNDLVASIKEINFKINDIDEEIKALNIIDSLDKNV